MEAMGTTYCEEAHRRTIKKLEFDGKFSEKCFCRRYIYWLFGDESDSDSCTKVVDRSIKIQMIFLIKTQAQKTEGWVNHVYVEEGRWKYGFCMVLNHNCGTKCTACDTEQPGHEEKLYEYSSSYGREYLHIPPLGKEVSSFFVWSARS